MADAVRLEITVDDKGSPVIKAVSDKLEGLGKSAQNAAGGQLKLNDAATRGTEVLGDFGIAAGGVVSRVASAIGPIGLLTATVGTGLVAATTHAINEFQKFAFQVRDLSYLSGGSAQDVAGLLTAMEDLGVESGTVEQGINKMSQAIAQGDPTLQRLGISFRTQSGALKDGLTLFYETIDTLRGMGNEMERNRAAQEIFGRGWTAMVPAIREGSTAIKQMGEENAATGKTMTESGIRAAEDYRRAVNDLKDVVEGLTVAWGNRLIPVFTSWLQRLVPGTNATRDYREEMALLWGQVEHGAAAYKDLDAEQRRFLASSENIARHRPATPKSAYDPTQRELEEAQKQAEKLREIRTKNDYESLKAQQAILDEANALGVKYTEEERKRDEEAAKDKEKQNLYIAEQEAKALDQLQKDRTEFLIWETDQTKAAVEAEQKIRQEQAEADIKSWVVRIEQEQALDDQAAKDEVERLQKLAKEREERWNKSFSNIRGITEDAFSGMNRAFSTSMSGVILGTQTIEDAFKRMGENIVIGLVDSIVNRGLRVVQESLLDFVFGSSNGGGGGGISIGGIGSLVSTAADIGGGIVDWVGTFLGSFAGGQWAVPTGKATTSATGSRWAPKGDATAAGWAILHPGEMVLPPELAELVRIALAQRGIQSLEELQARAGGGRGGTSSLGGQYGALSGAERSTLSSFGAYGKGFGIGAGLLGGLFGSLGLAALGPVGAFGVKSIGAVLGIDALMSALGIASPIGYVGPTEADFQSIRDYAGVFAEAQAREQAALEAAVTESMRGETSPTAQGVLDAIEAGFRSEFDAMEAAAREAAREAAEREAGGGRSGGPGGEGPSGGPGSGESSGMGSGTTGMASGGLFRTRGRLRMTVGEAGSETVAVLRNPRDVALAAGQGGSGAPVTINLYNSGVIGNQLPDNLMREIQRELVRRESRLLRY